MLQADVKDLHETADQEPQEVQAGLSGDQVQDLNEGEDQAMSEGTSENTPDSEAESSLESSLEIQGPEAGHAPATPGPDQAAPRFSRLYFTPVKPVPADIVPHKEEFLELPDTAVEDILVILTGAFYTQTGIDLASRGPQELDRFAAEARRIRKELQDRDAALVEFNEILGTYFLQCVVLRETVVALQELRAANQGSPTGSAWAGSHLPPDYFALADQGRQRLLLAKTAPEGTTFWQIGLGHLPDCKAVRDVLWMPGLSFLLTDGQSRQVMELGFDGRVNWKLGTDLSPEHGLRSPVKATWYRDSDGNKRYLIVDQAHHRVLEVDENQQVTWQYGVMGQSRDLAGYLNTPVDVQYTPQKTYLICDLGNHRVIEVQIGLGSQGSKIIQSFSEVDGLDRPVYAERLPNGHTLVVDEVRHGILEFDTKHQRVRECYFFRPGMDERLKTGKGLRAFRRADNTLVLIDGERLMLVDYINQKILWFAQLRTLQPLLSNPIELAAVEAATALQLSRAYENYDTVVAPTEMVTLRQMLMQVPLFESEKMPYFFEDLEKILKFRDFQPGAMIIEKGKPLKSMFFIQSGSVEMLGENEGEPVVEMKAGESFGMMGIVYVEPRSSTIRAKAHCGLFELEKRAFDRLQEHYPEIAAVVTKLASERLAVTRIKQGQTEEKTKARFQEVLAMQKARFSSASAKVAEAAPAGVPPVRPTAQRPSFKAHRPEYNEEEKHLIHEALEQGQRCLEIHIFIHRTCMMKGARAFLIIMVLEKLGHILRSTPSLEDIRAEKATSSEVIVTLATNAQLEQVIEDASSVAEIDQVEVISLGP